MKKLWMVLCLMVCFSACGGGAMDMVLNVEGKVTVSDVPQAPLKFGVLQSQVHIISGIIEIEYRMDFPDGIEIRVVNLDASASTPDFTLSLELDPAESGDPDANQGILYKRQDGSPLGDSFIQLIPQLVLPDGQTSPLGALFFQADDPQEPDRIPLLGQIPVVNFLFNNQEKQAEITELVILITPQVVEDLNP